MRDVVLVLFMLFRSLGWGVWFWYCLCSLEVLDEWRGSSIVYAFLVWWQVLATGLSGLYSSLPRKITPPSEDWYALTEDDCHRIVDLQMFLNSLEFCNAVVQVGMCMWCVCVCMCVCVYVWERENMCVCVCVYERENMCVCERGYISHCFSVCERGEQGRGKVHLCQVWSLCCRGSKMQGLFYIRWSEVLQFQYFMDVNIRKSVV